MARHDIVLFRRGADLVSSGDAAGNALVLEFLRKNHDKDRGLLCSRRAMHRAASRAPTQPDHHRRRDRVGQERLEIGTRRRICGLSRLEGF